MLSEELSTKQLINAALKVIGITGLVGISIESPSTTDALGRLGVIDETISPEKRSRLIQELRRQELITETREGTLLRLQLTIKGAHRLQRTAIDELSIATPATWDHKWRLVMFDIPSRHQESRYLLTSQLKRLGFVLVQNSVWAHPYPCVDVIEQIVTYANLQSFVTIAEVVRLDESSSRRLLRHWPQLRDK